jgi:DNA ligase D-like protein (predicted ligase)
MPGPLPEFIAPMLAKIGRQPFDSDQHLFEIKWDGTRALAFVESGRCRLRNRRRRDITPKYPELAFLAGIEPGIVIDGEICVLRDGRPDFAGMLEREQARSERRSLELARTLPATYVAFDLLYRAHESIMAEPLLARRERLRAIVAAADDQRLLFSDGVRGAGVQFFEQLRAQQLEGMIAKRVDSRYRPGERTDAWLKIKPAQRLHCAIVGYQAQGGDLRSLIIASPDDAGRLQCVGRVGSGLRRREAAELLALLRKRPRATPLIECGMQGEWVEPGLYCVVSFFERSATGLRGPVFEGLVEEP